LIRKRNGQLLIFSIAIALAVLLLIALSVDLLPPPPQSPTPTRYDGIIAPGKPPLGP
jgi:hypothetical protein